jgi:hypothetical protein
MQTEYDIVWFFLLGTICGWCLYGIILQLSYRFGIIEYKGIQRKEDK